MEDQLLCIRHGMPFSGSSDKFRAFFSNNGNNSGSRTVFDV